MAKIKGMDGETHHVTSRGQGALNTVLGAVGTAGAISNGGFLGNLFGGGAPRDGQIAPQYESKEAAMLRQENAELRSQNFSRQSSTEAFERGAEYTTRLHNEQALNIKELFNQVITQGVAIQKIDDKIDTKFALLKGEIATQAALADKDRTAILKDIDLEAERRKCGDDNLAKDIQIEAERRSCADNTIVNYVNSTFYVNEIADVDTASTTTSAVVRNPLGCCQPTCFI